MTEAESCMKIFLDLKKLLTSREYNEANSYLLSLKDGTVSEIKSALIMTKAFKEHDVLKDSRNILLNLYETKLGRKSYDSSIINIAG